MSHYDYIEILSENLVLLRDFDGGYILQPKEGESTQSFDNFFKFKEFFILSENNTYYIFDKDGNLITKSNQLFSADNNSKGFWVYDNGIAKFLEDGKLKFISGKIKLIQELSNSENGISIVEVDNKFRLFDSKILSYSFDKIVFNCENYAIFSNSNDLILFNKLNSSLVNLGSIQFIERIGNSLFSAKKEEKISLYNLKGEKVVEGEVRNVNTKDNVSLLKYKNNYIILSKDDVVVQGLNNCNGVKDFEVKKISASKFLLNLIFNDNTTKIYWIEDNKANKLEVENAKLVGFNIISSLSSHEYKFFNNFCKGMQEIELFDFKLIDNDSKSILHGGKFFITKNLVNIPFPVYYFENNELLCNYMDKEGHLLLEKPFKNIILDNFKEGYALNKIANEVYACISEFGEVEILKEYSLTDALDYVYFKRNLLKANMSKNKSKYFDFVSTSNSFRLTTSFKHDFLSENELLSLLRKDVKNFLSFPTHSFKNSAFIEKCLAFIRQKLLLIANETDAANYKSILTFKKEIELKLEKEKNNLKAYNEVVKIKQFVNDEIQKINYKDK